jgi:hypothetical protein
MEMLLLSCVNCCFNGMQSELIGTQVGYCTEHRSLLRLPESLTCGRHLRKDLALPEALREQALHQQRFTGAHISVLRDRTRANGELTSKAEKELATLKQDDVGVEVTHYGDLGTKIESLARLWYKPGARSEVARLSLGRTHVKRCVERGGSWTSGLHMLWWTLRQIDREPEVKLEDIRVAAAIPMDRQVEIAGWSILMARLLFVGDIGYHGGNHASIRRLASIVEDAAAATKEIKFSRLMSWIRRTAKARMQEALPEATYEKLARGLHKEPTPARTS